MALNNKFYHIADPDRNKLTGWDLQLFKKNSKMNSIFYLSMGSEGGYDYHVGYDLDSPYVEYGLRFPRKVHK